LRPTDDSDDSAADVTYPLAGVLVADFSRVLAGPMATMHLADLGATVIKVERPESGDDTRAWGPPWTTHSSVYYESLNRNKFSVALDLTNPAHQRAAIELTQRADVVIENFRPGALARFALDYKSVASHNPTVVYCSISGFGSDAGADLPGYDFLVQAVGGLMSITGEAGGQPTKVGVALVDVLTGKDAIIGILAGLTARTRTGRGDHIEVNLLSSLLAGLVNQAATYLSTGASPERIGNRHPSIAPYEMLRCADGMIAIACGNDSQFVRLVNTLGRPELGSAPRFATNAARVEHRDELAHALEAALGAAPTAEWEQRLTAVGVPAGAVADIGAAVARADALGLGPTIDLGDGWSPQIRNPVSFASATGHPLRPPPDLGQHTEQVLEWLASAPSRPFPYPAG
jgi:crotonobetainyl-CoA:carnitine CoA-transferase CaiB-like acyl-CoA transferase